MIIMKIFFTCLSNHKKMLLVAVVSLMTFGHASANSYYYNHYVVLNTYPTGKGKVYAEIPTEGVKTEDANFDMHCLL